MIRGGLKKCVPRNCLRKCSGSACAISAMPSPEVLELSTALGFTRSATWRHNARFGSICSMMASTTQSASRTQSKSVSTQPGVIRVASWG
jgi:hypothetical protein